MRWTIWDSVEQQFDDTLMTSIALFGAPASLPWCGGVE
jgi:hypothetical protein